MPFPDARAHGVAVTPSGERVFVSMNEGKGIVVLDAEKEECLPPVHGLVNYYPGDGTLDDAHGVGALGGGTMAFAPGLQGQAFRFNGKSSYLSARAGSSYCPFCTYSWTEAFFVKFDAPDEEMTILETASMPPGPGRRVFRAHDRHVVLESNGGRDARLTIRSAEALVNARWYHLAVVTDRDQRSFYIDGRLQGKHTIQPSTDDGAIGPLYIGATQGKRNFLSGLMDELVVYNRVLTQGEIRTMSERSHGACMQ
jgi:hypothetical protein